MQEFRLQLSNLKLDWASGKPLTTTLSSQVHLLLNHIKEDLGLLSRLLSRLVL